MKLRDKIRLGLLISFLVIVFIGVIIYLTDSYKFILPIIKQILDSGMTLFIIWLVSLVMSVYYYLVVEKDEKNTKILIKKFGPFFDSILTGVTYGMVMQTAIVILRRLVNQAFFNERYFYGFSSWDLTLIGLLMAYLLYWCSMKLYSMAYEIFIVPDLGMIESESNSKEVMKNGLEKNKN